MKVVWSVNGIDVHYLEKGWDGKENANILLVLGECFVLEEILVLHGFITSVVESQVVQILLGISHVYLILFIQKYYQQKMKKFHFMVFRQKTARGSKKVRFFNLKIHIIA